MAMPWPHSFRGLLLLLSWPSYASALASSGGSLRQALSTAKGFKIHDHGGLFEGSRFFAHALTHDMPEDLQKRLEGCNVHLRGDSVNPRHEGVDDWGQEGRLWIVVNGEHFWGDAIRDTSQQWMGPNDRLLVLGTWINESVAEARDDKMSSLWVPYASLYFADRREKTPMDLRYRLALEDARAAPLAFSRSMDQEHIVAYLHRHCEEKREAAWDTLNEKLYSTTGHRGSALGKCNGNRHLGKQVRNLGQVGAELDTLGNVRTTDQAYDAVEHMYDGFLFALTMENEVNKVGYISEKIVNAYLSGTVPIYEGAKQIETVFNPASFVHVNGSMASSVDHLASLLKDSGAYDRLRRPDAGVVSDESLRAFFSWHPAVWPSHGDRLRRRILEEVARHCSGMQSQEELLQEDHNPKSSISYVAEWLMPEEHTQAAS